MARWLGKLAASFVIFQYHEKKIVFSEDFPASLKLSRAFRPTFPMLFIMIIV